jgi:DNA-binding NtrC family response regulator
MGTSYKTRQGLSGPLPIFVMIRPDLEHFKPMRTPSMSASILVVDDDPVQRRLLEAVVTKLGYRAVGLEGGELALNYMASPSGADVRVILLDLVMPDLDGMAVLEKLNERGSKVPVIVETSQGSIDTVVSAMRMGAFDFVVKPVSPERLQVSIQNALKLDALEGAVTRIRKKAEGTLTFKDIITQSDAMDRVLRLGERAAKSQIPILVEGESGVGKELIARAIQGSGPRKGKPFVTVNCGAIPENLVESILFGHEKGAFTGATDKHIGKFQEAHGGTLFLDEVGELPADIQVKLLRAIQEGEIDPIGAKKPIRVDFRLISATNKTLLDMTKDGRFREDLYYRLNVFPIWVPPLRDRKDDIPDLIQHFLARFAAEEGKRRIAGISSDALRLLMAYDWPGNIRQLENAIFRAVVLCDDNELGRQDFPQIAAQVDGFEIDIPPLKRTEPAEVIPSPQSESRLSYGTMQLVDAAGELKSINDLEEEAIRFAIEHCHGRMTDVARNLGMGRSTLYRKLKEYGIDPDSETIAAQ